MRSTVNYPSFLAKRLDAKLTDLTVSGATLLNVLDTPQGMLKSFRPQVDGVTSDADIVTITAGGNDMGYIGGMMRDSFGLVGTLLVGSANAASLAGEDEVVERFEKVIDVVREKAPRARIILVEYLTLLGRDIKPGVNVPLDVQQVEKYREMAKTLNRIYARAAEGKQGVEVIPIAETSEDHGVGSEEPWVSGHGWGLFYGGEMPWHPNEKGMKAVAETLYERLKAEPRPKL